MFKVCEQHLLLCGPLSAPYVTVLQGYFNKAVIEGLKDAPDTITTVIRENPTAAVWRYQAGQPGILSDSPDGLPAYQKFSLKTGALVAEYRMQNGQLHDDFVLNIPALQLFNEDTGRLTRAEHYKEGVLFDPADDQPGLLHFNQNGRLINAARIEWDDLIPLTAAELKPVAEQACKLWSHPSVSTIPFRAPRR